MIKSTHFIFYSVPLFFKLDKHITAKGTEWFTSGSWQSWGFQTLFQDPMCFFFLLFRATKVILAARVEDKGKAKDKGDIKNLEDRF